MPKTDSVATKPDEATGKGKKTDWAALAELAYSKNTTYFDNNFRKKIEDAYRHWMNKHASGSKYNTSSYKYRSRLFRPKSRAAERSNEAAAMAAFFTNPDALSIDAQDEDNPVNVASADVIKADIDYRLSGSGLSHKDSIPWFMICMGAFQDAQVTGVVASYNDWSYKEKERKYDVKVGVYDENNNLVNETTQEQTETVVVEDKPVIKLLPVENVRIDPAANWLDPVNTSASLVILWPMYVKDVLARMDDGADKIGEKKWKRLEDDELLAASRYKYDSTRSVREDQREDSTDQQGAEELSMLDIVWVHENFIDIGGEDMRFFTIGDRLLSDPKPTDERYPQGRPVTMGCCIIETHKTYPSSPIMLTKDMQTEINHVANDRRDNVSLVINKRYKVKKGKGVDFRSILRNAAGSIIPVENMDDVDTLEFNDVTSSSYAEHDRLNIEFDGLFGSFGQDSVMSNRKMNETVGGMEMAKMSSQTVTDYGIKIFGESWAEPTLKQIVKLVQMYETDQTVLALAAQKAKLFKRYGIDRVTDELISQNLIVKIDVGPGATDPQMRLQRLLIGVDKAVDIATKHAQLPQPVLKLDEVFKEIFGILGRKDGTRFLVQPDDESIQQLQQMEQVVQEMQQAIQELQAQLEDKSADRQVKLIDRQMSEEGQNQRKMAEIQAEREGDLREIESEQIDRQMSEAGQNQRKMADIQADLEGKLRDIENEQKKMLFEAAMAVDLAKSAEDNGGNGNNKAKK